MDESQAALSWERVLWRCRPWWRPGATYLLSDFRVLSFHPRRVAEIALQDVGDVEHRRGRVDRLLGTSTVIVRARTRQSPVVFRHVRKGAQLAALIELLAGDPQASINPEAVQAALSWEPQSSRRGRHWREAAAALAVVVAVVVAVAPRLQSSSPSIAFGVDDAIYPGGLKRDREAIVRFMENEVMPWARAVLGPLQGGADQVTCATCHGMDADQRGFAMPGVAALPEPHFKTLGWETYSARMDAQMRNAIYGYLAEADNQARAAYMREVVLPGMARLLRRPAYDFTRSYEHNRSRAAFGCYHCHKVR